MNIEIYQGETPVLEFEIVDAAGENVNLTGSAVYFLYRKPDTNIITVKNCTVSGNKAIVELQDTKDLTGLYDYELKIIDANNKVDIVISSNMIVKKSIDAANEWGL